MVLCQDIVFTLTLLTAVAGFSFDDVIKSRELRGSEFAVGTVKNYFQCKNLCDSRPACRAFNYNTKTRECVSNLLDTATSVTELLQPAKDVVFAEKRSMKENDICSDKNCEASQICVQIASDRTCLEEIICKIPRIKFGTFISDNLILGSRGSVRCDEYFRFFGDSDSARCESIGVFSGLHGDCKQVIWINESTPLIAFLPEPIRDGWQMLLEGTVGITNTSFDVNFKGENDVYYFHMDGRFNKKGDKKTVVFNYKLNTWSKQSVRIETNFPFKLGTCFRLRILVNGNTVEFIVGDFSYNFTLPVPAKQVKCVAVNKDVFINKLHFLF